MIGTGNIGETVGEAWRLAGHEVVYASRSPAPPRTVAIADAIAGAEVVLLATPGAAVPPLLAEHGPALDGRVVIDATNDIGRERLHHADTYGESAPVPASFARSTRSALRSWPTRRSVARWRTCSGVGRRTRASTAGRRCRLTAGAGRRHRCDRRGRRRRPAMADARVPPGSPAAPRAPSAYRLTLRSRTLSADPRVPQGNRVTTHGRAFRAKEHSPVAVAE